MKVAPLITVALILCIAFPGLIQAKKKPKPKKFCVGKDGNRYEEGEGYVDREGKACIHYKCAKKKGKLVMKTKECVEDGEWSPWSSWSDCSATCGRATKKRTRTCSNPEPSNGGKPCNGTEKENKKCSNPPCGPDINEKVDMLELNFLSLNDNVQSLNDSMQTLQTTMLSVLELMTTIQSTADKQGSCMSDLSSSSCPHSAPGKIGVVDGFNSNKAGINTNMAGINTNMAGINTNMAGINSNKADINTNKAGITSTKADINANKAEITSTKADINTNKAGITSAKADINANKAGVISTKADISTNKADINTNKAEIILTKADINTNKAGININKAGINTNVADINTNEADINTNEADINTNEADINTNVAGINTNKADISTNKAGVNSNIAGINTNKADINTNKAGVNTNEADINTNEAGINTNKADINSNKAGVNINKAGINTNEAAINTNKADINTNKAGINTNKADISTNKAGVNTNMAGINTNKAGINTNKDDIISNKDAIAAHHTDCDDRVGTTLMWVGSQYIEVRCEESGDMSGSWTLIQRRGQYGNAEDMFYQPWVQYEDGFGSLKNEFWLGLKNIVDITKKGQWQLQVDLTDWDGKKYFARYDGFSVGPAPRYQLNIQSFDDKSTLGDSLMARHSGKPFTTYDNDQDNSNASNCGELRKGGWWYDSCTDSNLNGLNHAQQVEDWIGMAWEHGKTRGDGKKSWQASVIKIRKTNI